MTLYAVWQERNYDFSASGLAVTPSEIEQYGKVTVKFRLDSWDRNMPDEDNINVLLQHWHLMIPEQRPGRSLFPLFHLYLSRTALYSGFFRSSARLPSVAPVRQAMVYRRIFRRASSE